MKTYLIRSIPVDLWRDVKVQAAERGLTVREVILALLLKWVRARRS